MQSRRFVNYMTPGHVVYPNNYSGYGGNVAMVAPALAWARENSPKYGLLTERYALLSGNGYVYQLWKDVPLRGRRLSAYGYLLGITAGRLCTLNGGFLQVVHLDGGQAQSVNVGEIVGADPLMLNAILDGTVVYFCGELGVCAINVLRGETIFVSPWPQELVPAQEEASDETVAQNMMTPQMTMHFMQQRMMQQGGHGYYTGGMMIYQYNDGRRVGMRPDRGLVADGLVIVPYGPGRLVALEHDDEEGSR